MSKEVTIRQIIIIVVIILLILSNAFFAYKYFSNKSEDIINDNFDYNKNSNKDYNKNEKYYKEINYKQFKKLNKQNELITIAIIDNSSNTYDKFLELVNKLSYYNNYNIYVLEISKLSKKNEISFYEIDERFNELESDYLITMKEGKLLSITEFDKSELKSLVEGMES